MFWLSLKHGSVQVTSMTLRSELYVQLVTDSYMFQGVIPEAEVLACYLKTSSP